MGSQFSLEATFPFLGRDSLFIETSMDVVHGSSQNNLGRGYFYNTTSLIAAGLAHLRFINEFENDVGLSGGLGLGILGGLSQDYTLAGESVPGIGLAVAFELRGTHRLNPKSRVFAEFKGYGINSAIPSTRPAELIAGLLAGYEIAF